MICKSIVLLEHIGTDLDVMEITFDTGTALMIGHYNETIPYLNQEVLVDFREDLYKGNVVKFVSTLTTLVKVNTIDKKENIRLYTEDPYNYSDVAFMDIDIGQTQQNCIIYCNTMEYESSASATWCTLTCSDKLGRIAKVRVFDYVKTDINCAGKYIRTDLRRTKYGFVSEVVLPVDKELPENPEVAIAADFVVKCFSEDTEMIPVLSTSNIIEHIKQHVSLEKGYELVYMANELNLIGALENSSPHLDVQSLRRAVLFSRFYLKENRTDLSHGFFNLAAIMSAPITHKKLLINILDFEPEYVSAEREIYIQIKRLANNLIETRKVVKT